MFTTAALVSTSLSEEHPSTLYCDLPKDANYDAAIDDNFGRFLKDSNESDKLAVNDDDNDDINDDDGDIDDASAAAADDDDDKGAKQL